MTISRDFSPLIKRDLAGVGNEYFENLLAVHLWFGNQPGRLSDSLAHKLSDKPLRNLWYIVVHILSGKQFHKLAH